jgi:hypothetical protein
MRPALRDDVMFAAELLAARKKMINAVQVAAVLEHVGLSAPIDWVRAELYGLASENAARLIRTMRIVGDGPSELLQYFVLAPRTAADSSTTADGR